MGMGEPLLNYEATVEALRILMDEEGFGVPPRKLTLSTVGILPALEKLAQEPVRPNLAISLHAPDPGLRRALMPIEEKYSFDRVVEAALRYPIPRGGLVTFEYVLLGGVNDTVAHARELARRLGGKRVKVNLIPLNPAPEIPFKAPTPEAVDAFGAGPRRGRRHGVRAAAARAGHPRRLRAAPPQEGRPRARPGAPLTTPPLPAPRFAAALALLALGLLALLLPHLGAAPLERAEIYFLDAARAMVESGDWVIPRYEGQPFFDKPILSYWLMAGAMSGLGPGAGAARLVPVAASIGVLLATAWLGTLLFDRRSALAGGLVLATTLAFLSFARVAMSDMLLAALHDAGRRPRRPRVPARGAGLGGAAARRGGGPRLRDEGPGRAPRPRPRRPPADVGEPAPADPVRRGARSPSASSPSPCSASAGSRSSTGGWGRSRSSPSSSARTWSASPARRTTWAGPSGSTRPRTSRRGCRGRRSCRSPCGACCARATATRRARARFLAVWVALVLVPLSLSRGKIDYYLLPIYPAVSLVIGRYLAGVPWKRADRALGQRRRSRSRRRRSSSSSPCRRGSPTRGCPGPCRGRSCVAVVAAGAALLARRRRAPDAAPRRGRARLAGRRGLARARRLLPAGLRLGPAQPRDRGRRGAREVVPVRPRGWPSAPTRPA